MKKPEKKFDSHLGKFREDRCRLNLVLSKGKTGEGKKILSAERENYLVKRLSSIRSKTVPALQAVPGWRKTITPCAAWQIVTI